MDMDAAKKGFAAIESYIEANNTLVLSTCRENLPRATPLVYKFSKGRFLLLLYSQLSSAFAK